MLVFVDLEKAFDSLPTSAICRRLVELRCSRNLVQSVTALLGSPVGRLRGNSESFVMERGVRQGSKEGPLLFNITFQFLLEEVYSLADSLGVTMVAPNGEEWSLNHIEYADDLCMVCADTEGAARLLEKLDSVLSKYHMSLASDKTKWMFVGGPPEEM